MTKKTKNRSENRTVFSILLLALVWSAASGANALPADPDRPAAPGQTGYLGNTGTAVLEAAEFNFGVVEAGATVEHTFFVKNLGKKKLEIIKVQPSCGCTTAGEWDKQIEPGQTGRVPLRLNTAGFSGGLEKHATIYLSEPGAVPLVARLRGQVKTNVEIIPPNVYFYLRDPGQQDKKTVRIVSNEKEPLILGNLNNPLKQVRANLRTVQPGKIYEVEVETRPPLAYGPFYGNLLIPKIKSPGYIAIPVGGNVAEPVAARPKIVYLTKGIQPKVQHRAVQVFSSLGKPLSISEVKVNQPGVNVNVKQLNFLSWVIELEFPQGWSFPTGRLALEFKTDNKEMPRVTVPIQPESDPDKDKEKPPVSFTPPKVRR